ncbi:MAG: DUF4279 domain-containing protein [Mycobacteriales bacterium]
MLAPGAPHGRVRSSSTWTLSSGRQRNRMSDELLEYVIGRVAHHADELRQYAVDHGHSVELDLPTWRYVDVALDKADVWVASGLFHLDLDAIQFARRIGATIDVHVYIALDERPLAERPEDERPN